MKRISIERYSEELTKNPAWEYAGLIEGEADDGTGWVMWLDAGGRPTRFWPNREDSGAVIGEGIALTSEGILQGTLRREAKLREILSADPDPAAVVRRLEEALEAVERFHRDGNPYVEESLNASRRRNTPAQQQGKPA